ncbi:MAG: response regulator [bacterium]
MDTHKFKIAIIEDSETSRFFYKVTFKKWGFEVFEAETGTEGWEIILHQNPDLVVLDMMLPDTNGFEMLKKIRANQSTKKIPVLVLTSDKEIIHVQRALQLGANHYSVKGKDSLEKIKSMIFKLLQKSYKNQTGISKIPSS